MNSTDVKNFSSLGLSENLLKAISDLGFSEMTQIQAASIPLILEGKDMIGQSQTGSGKTAAFIIPILQKIDVSNTFPQALILCPTRELSDQVFREVGKFSKSQQGFRAALLVGGQPYPPQNQALERGVHIVVGTPGRTLEHLNQGHLDLNSLKVLVLDEADKMLDEGFQEEVSSIINLLPEPRQTIFFSATISPEVEFLSKTYQKNAQRVTIESNTQGALQIKQFVYSAENYEKVQTLIRILQKHPSMSTLIFCRTKATVAEIGTLLEKFKVSSSVLHGDLTQADRDKATSFFRNGSLRILVATDVAARGLDIDRLELVINVDLPPDADTYIHRIGRTGRAGRTGTAVSIATEYETTKVPEIEKATGVKMIRQELGFKNQLGLSSEFQKSLMKTLRIAGGKANKLRPGDILGALTSDKTFLVADIGKIEIYETYSYVAVDYSVAEKALNKLRTGKIKGAKFKVELLDFT